MKKYKTPLEQVRRILRESGYFLLSDEDHYKANDKVAVRCPNNHEYEVRVRSFVTDGRRCVFCRRKNQVHSPKLGKYDLEMVRELFSQDDYVLLSTTYQKMAQKVLVRCPNNHEVQITPSNFLQGKRCRLCYIEGQKHSLDELRQLAQKDNYRILSTAYTRSEDKLSWECPSGHLYEASWDSFKQGHRCKECHYLEISLGLDKIKSTALDDGYLVISDRYAGNREPVTFSCPLGHVYETMWNTFQMGSRCPTCAVDRSKRSVEEIVVEMAKEGFRLRSDYHSNNSEIEVECNAGHLYKTTWASFQQGIRCKICGITRPELEISEFIKSLGFKVTHRDRVLLNGRELDIWCPDKNLAIEFNGLYWHSLEVMSRTRKNVRVRYLAQDKMHDCRKMGIRLLTIFEDEWNFKREIAKDRIKHALGVQGRVIYARHCSVNEANQTETAQFLNSYHIQGSSPRRVGFKLTFNGEIVGVLTLGPPSRAHVAPGAYELKRLAFKANCSVVGGASKLFSVASKYLVEMGKTRIISFCDMRWGNGTVYQKLGFVLRGESRPSPHITNCEIRKHYQSFVKKSTNQWLTIYDCGHQTWEKNL